MSSNSIPRKSPVLPERADYTLELITNPNGGEAAVVRANLEPKSTYRWNPDTPNDPTFNLSAMIGNDNGKFVWGRAAFEGSGRNFSLKEDPTTRACILHGELLTLQGGYNVDQINLDESIQVMEYVDQGTNDTFHRLQQRKPTPPKRTLVLCFDGTSNHFSNKNTNVVKLVELLKKNDPSRQMVYYQTGVGTYAPPGMMTSIGLSVAEKADEGAAWYLYQHVIDGYKYLMQTYRIGDSISIFGFSRGAFTARALAGMLHCVGLLPRHNLEHVPFAYEVYKSAKDYNYKSTETATTTTPANRGERPEDVDPDDFKRTFCMPVKIDFVGVWDTVASVGALIPKTLPWIEYNPSIVTFRQALALDERRGNFIPSVWDHLYTDNNTQDVREVWFRGEHSDIGGGSAMAVPISDDKKPATTAPGEKLPLNYSMLSNITLRWMVRQMVDCKTGILFDYNIVDLYRARDILEDPPTTGSKKDWVNRVEESIKLDREDVKHGIYDSIKWSPLWNTLEYLAPIAKPTKDEEFNATTTRWPNAKAGRAIYNTKPGDPIFIHSSVVDYLMSTSEEATKEKYMPRAKWYGYGANDWPRIEDVSHNNHEGHSADEGREVRDAQANSVLSDSAKAKLQMERPPKVDDKKKGWWPF